MKVQIKKLPQNDTFVGVALALVVFLVYLSTLASTIQFEDCGELAADVSTLGITHPTGYPLLTLLAWGVAHLPFHTRIIWILNLLVAVFCSVAVFFFYQLFLLMLSKKTLSMLKVRPASAVTAKKKETPTESVGSLERMAAAIGTLILAFSETFWSQAVSFEVYALHLLFLSLLILLFLRAELPPV